VAVSSGIYEFECDARDVKEEMADSLPHPTTPQTETNPADPSCHIARIVVRSKLKSVALSSGVSEAAIDALNHDHPSTIRASFELLAESIVFGTERLPSARTA
jgi:hypothetical protein